MDVTRDIVKRWVMQTTKSIGTLYLRRHLCRTELNTFTHYTKSENID
jgi:hypothetical protein